MKATTSRETIALVEAQVPFTHHVCGIASILEALWQGDHVKRQTVGLPGPDNGMLETCVDLIPEEREEDWVEFESEGEDSTMVMFLCRP